jgi:hypothetical protein
MMMAVNVPTGTILPLFVLHTEGMGNNRTDYGDVGSWWVVMVRWCIRTVVGVLMRWWEWRVRVATTPSMMRRWLVVGLLLVMLVVMIP